MAPIGIRSKLYKTCMRKNDRVRLAAKYGGMCAYCGLPLGDRWHADHLEPIGRIHTWVDGKGFRPTGICRRPERDEVGNVVPACAPCNIAKGSLSLEQWRTVLSGAPGILSRSSSTYRNAIRFHLLQETGEVVVFHLESIHANDK